MSSTPFEILGLPATATVDEVEHAWKLLASVHHPDRGGDAAKFIEFREAYQSARELAAEPKMCETCQGKGKVVKSFGFSSMKVFCGDCGGTGEK
jgi:DnaJ-class molecular chaperone